MMGPVRPAVDTTGFEIKRIQGIANFPGDPGYAEKIPPAKDDSPHIILPNGQEAVALADNTTIIEAATQIANAFPANPPVVTMRVGIYSGRGDLFNVIVEQAPDWDTIRSIRCTVNDWILISKVLEALQVKVVDKTGGDLDEAIEHLTARQPSPQPVVEDRGRRQPARSGRRKAAGGDSSTAPA